MSWREITTIHQFWLIFLVWKRIYVCVCVFCLTNAKYFIICVLFENYGWFLWHIHMHTHTYNERTRENENKANKIERQNEKAFKLEWFVNRSIVLLTAVALCVLTGKYNVNAEYHTQTHILFIFYLIASFKIIPLLIC